MRVTKLIREYVEEEVAKAIPYGEPTENWKKEVACLNDLTTQLNEQVEKYADELLASVGNLPEGFIISKRKGYRIIEGSSFNSPLDCARREHERDIRDKRKKAVDTILISLELGATRAELADLMKSVVAEVVSE